MIIKRMICVCRMVSVVMLMLILNQQVDAATSSKRYAGGDISLLPAYEDAGAKYYDHEGNYISDLLPFLGKEGMNAMRVRVFVNPADYTGPDKDPNACQTIESVIPLCQRIKATGMSLMLDFHYSDTWADPAQQYTPLIWANLDDTALCEAVYDYTRESLVKLRDAGVVPDFIQPGNEISFGMLWGPAGTPESSLKKTFMGSSANWDRLGALLRNAIKGCREVCPEARIVIHTERTADVAVQNNFYNEMKRLQVSYDIIGLSYYPYFHGPLSSLASALTSLEANFPGKDIMIVETGCSYKWEVPGTSCPVDYPYTEAGQDAFARDLVTLLETYDSVTGLFWWWLEYNAYGTSLSGWYNAPLFDSTSGKALTALKTICSFASSANGVGSTFDETEHQPGEMQWYDVAGRKIAQPGQGISIGKRGTGAPVKIIGRRPGL